MSTKPTPPARSTARKPLFVECDDCGHAWVAAFPPLAATDLARILDRARCAHCDGQKISALPANDEIVGAGDVTEAMEDGAGFWRSCSGCHEINEGTPTGPYNRILQCHLGVGCCECGGIGAIWDTTDYADMGGAYLSGERNRPMTESNNTDERDYVIWSNEHTAWWAPNECGYRSRLSDAGRYDREEALRICTGARGGREYNDNPTEVPLLAADAELFWPDAMERYRPPEQAQEEQADD